MSKKHVEVYIDPKVELISIIPLLAPWSNVSTRIKEYPYLRGVYNYFGKWKNHEAVQFFTKLMYSGFSIDALLGLPTHLSDPPELKIRVEFSDYIIEKAHFFE